MLNQSFNIDKSELNKTLDNGGVIAFVTDTVWGLGCLPNNKKGIDKIYEIKGRDRTKPLILMSDEVQNLYPYVENLSNNAKALINQYFPGALTVIAEKSEKTSFDVTSGKNTVGIRVPDNKFFKELCKAIESHVLATTSANLSNNPSSKSYEEAKQSIGSYVDILYEDFGYKCKGLESTVVLATDSDIKILRQGSINLDNYGNI